MRSETQIAELLSLLKDTREQLTYFKELGVEGTEKSSPPTEAFAMPTRAAVAFQPDSVANPINAAAVVTGSSDSLFGDLTAPPLKIQKSAETFAEIWADIGDCTRCPLYQG
ncbi:MAG TPA: hypothetical protein VGO73_10875, partial [Pyrinomonadaceae bacterium]|nr:hypothetical protein [Pyrinomonadaceae bacterium]